MSAGDELNSVIEDALTRLKPAYPDCISADYVNVYTFPQLWGNGSGGLGGMGVAAFRTYQCHVIVGPKGDAAVYHNNGVFCYYLEYTNEEFEKCLHSFKMPGRQENWKALEGDKVSREFIRRK